jgi:hypothetical protein
MTYIEINLSNCSWIEMIGKRLSVYGLVTLLILSASSLGACGNQPGEVRGVVTVASSGDLVTQAQVVVYQLDRAKKVTGADVFVKGSILQKQFVDDKAHYSFSLEPGSYIVEVWVEGLEVGNRMVQVKSGRASTADFQVEMPSP